MGSRFLSAYYLANVVLLAAYGAAKLLHARNGEAEWGTIRSGNLRSWEQQCLLSMAGVALLKMYKHKSWDQYFADVFWYGKSIVVLLLFLMDVRLLAWFMLLAWMAFALLPQPELRDDEHLVWLTPVSLKTQVLEPGNKTTWLVAFSSPSNSDCVHTMPMLANVAKRYASEHLKFGLLDVSVFRRLAAQLAIDTSTVARQLPVLMLFEKGKEADRVGYRKQGLLLPSDSFRRESDIVKKFSLEQRSKGEPVGGEPKKKR